MTSAAIGFGLTVFLVDTKHRHLTATYHSATKHFDIYFVSGYDPTFAVSQKTTYCWYVTLLNNSLRRYNIVKRLHIISIVQPA